jgi:FdrA protein
VVDLQIVEVSGWSAGQEDTVRHLLEQGRVVALLCDIPLISEIELKRVEGGLLLGPSCSFSIIGEKGVGIWNEVKPGPVGLVGTSSSGLRALACLLSGIGISHALHVGWRDLSQAVGAVSTRRAIRFLQDDPKTECIVVLGVSSSPWVVRKLVEDVGGRKPVVFLLPNSPAAGPSTLEEAAVTVARMMGQELNLEPSDDELDELAREEASKLAHGQKYVRGIFTGRFLCIEAQIILSRFSKTVYSNVPLRPRLRLPDPASSQGHTCVDISSPELSPESHPSVKPEPHVRRILREAKDPWTGSIVFDLTLGHGAHADPASVFSEAVAKAKEVCEGTGGYLPVFVSLIGTERDPQDIRGQARKLRKAGAIAVRSPSRASLLAIKTVEA